MEKVNRWIFYVLGMVVLAAGITLNTKTGLGVSPIISVAYCVSQIFELNFGDMTFVLYGIFVVVQLFLRERRERLATLLQFPLSLVFSRLLNLCSACIPYQAAAHSLPENLAVLALAIVLTGVGVALTVNMRLVPNPGDGIVQAVAQRMGRDQGFAKNVFDLGCVAATVCLGLLLTGRIVGIGLGGDPRFRELVRAMDREYGERFGAAALKCRSCHGLDDIRQACLLLRDGQVVACGAFRAMEEGTAELNWVYVRPEHRRRGCARQVVEVLELQALFQGFGRMVMEIGRDIPEAISLYRKMGYREIEPFTIFADNKDTLCMEKELL